MICICIILAGLALPTMVTAVEEEYSQGLIFNTPKFLIEQFDDEYKNMSNLDYWGTRSAEPTPVVPTYQNYVTEGWAYLEAGSYRDAGKSFEKAINLNSTSYDAWYGKGLALENQKRYLSAIDSYTRSLSYSKKPETSWGPNAGLGRSYLLVQQYEKARDVLTLAISQYEQAEELLPEELASMYRNLAKALEVLGELDAAQIAIESADQVLG
ncbi:MAG: tetratricopeptide repeat protein [Methanomicrobiales archaeon]|nr:tetratricopeptide repeat protein [Methanomicrobiales archaeon]